MRVSQSGIVNFSEKQKRERETETERDRERAKKKQYLHKGYTVKGEVRVKQHEKGDHTVIKSLKDIHKI